MPTPCKLQVCCIVAAVFAALTCTIFAPKPIHAQGSDNDYVDVAVILEAPDDENTHTGLDLDIVVVNHGSRTAYDVEVVVDVVYPDASSHFDSFTTDGVIEVPVGNASLENSKYRLRWSISELGGLQREELSVTVRIRQTSSPTFDKRKYTHEFFGEVTTSSFDRNQGNNTSRVWSVPYASDNSFNSHRGANALSNYRVTVTVDKPSPSQGDTVNFTITAEKNNGLFLPIDLEVAIELTGGLSVSGVPSYVSTDDEGTVKAKPDSVSYGDGVFTIGTLKYEPGTVNSVILPVRWQAAPS